MRNNFLNGKHYRVRAEECLAIAEEFLDSGTRTVILKVAADYDLMAVVVS